MKTLKFAVDQVKLLDISDAQNAVAEVWICHSGNNKHNLPISEETLREAEQTIVNKWLVAGWDGEDFKEHEVNQLIIGFFPKENDFRYVEKDNKTYFVANAIISKLYADWAFEVFEKENFRECSMEITVMETKIKDGFEWITAYIYNAVTVLGKNISPAMAGANVTITKFSESELVDIREEIVKKVFAEEKILGLEVDFVEFSKEKFAQKFSLSANEVWDMLNSACKEEKYQEEGETYQHTRYYMRDHDGQYIYAYDYKEDKYCAIPFSIVDGKAVCDFGNVKAARQTWVISEETDGGVMAFAKEILGKEFADLESKVEKLESEKKEFAEKIDTLEDAAKDVDVKFAEKEEELKTVLAEKDELAKFKAVVEDQERKNKIDFAINSVSDDLTKEQVEEWRGKIEEFASIDEFSNAIKAFAYENSKGKGKDVDGIVRMSLVDLDTKINIETKSVWERI